MDYGTGGPERSFRERSLGSNAWIGPIKEQRWIPVSERLPEVNRHYLVHCLGGHITTTFCAPPEYFDNRYNQNGDEKSEYFEVAREYGYTITHWMPLPDPPGEEG